MNHWLGLIILFLLPTVGLGSDIGRITVGQFSEMAPDSPITGWEPMTFKRIKSHSRYALVEDEGRIVVRADSNASASGLVRPIQIVPDDFPIFTWSWKVSNTMARGDVTKKSGDDYAARIYITFSGDIGQESFFQQTKMAALKWLYGETPPSAALAYVWGNRAEVETIHTNPYTDRLQMIVVESGPAYLNQWRKAQRDIVKDYRHAFGGDPPPISGVAIMTDTDNTGESATAWYGDIVFHRRSAE